MRIQGIDGLVVFLDPGKVTGQATLRSTGSFGCGQVDGLVEFGTWLGVVAEYWGSNVMIGWEAYQAAGARGSESTVGLRIMGVAEWFAHVHDWQVLPEAPAEQRVVASMGALRRIDWYRKGQPHAMAASQHLLAYLLRSGLAPEIVRNAFTDTDCGGTP